MGNRPNTYIGLGVNFEEDYSFAWCDSNDDEFENFAYWWRRISNFNPTCQPFNSSGEYASGFNNTDPRVDKYFDDRDKWDNDNPPPVQIELLGCYDDSNVILFVPGTVIHADWDAVKEVKLDNPGGGKAVNCFVDFCNLHCLGDGKYDKRPKFEPSWIVGCYYG